MRQLKEIATEIMKKNFCDDPKKMASALDLDLMYVCRAVGLAASDGTNQQKTFEFTIKLLPLLEEKEFLRLLKEGTTNLTGGRHDIRAITGDPKALKTKSGSAT